MKKLVFALAAAALLAIPIAAHGVAAATYQTRSNWTGGLSGGNMTFYDGVRNAGYPTASMWVNCPILYLLQDPYAGTIQMDDCLIYTAAEWTVTLTGAGTVTIDDNGVGGMMLLTNAAADNDSVEMVQETNNAVSDANYSLTAGHPLWFEIKLAVSDQTESDILVGLCEPDDTTLIDGLADGGVFFRKDDADANIDIVTEEATVETAADSGIDIVTNTFIRLGFYYNGATAGTVTFYINGVAVGTSTTNLPNHTLCPAICIQNGEAVAKILTIDYWKVVWLR